MLIDEICELLIEELMATGYDESTIFNYRGVIRRFKAHCFKLGVTEYSPAVGQTYADDVISIKTGKFSKQRYETQGRFIRLLNSYYYNQSFCFDVKKRGKIQPTNPIHLQIYKNYVSFLSITYTNINTRHFYEYGMYYLLKYMDQIGINNIEDLSVDSVYSYLASSKPERQRGILCELRLIFRYLKRDDLLEAIAGVRAPRFKRIISTLTDEEFNRIIDVINSGDISLRDATIVLVGLTCGIRSCDLINLRISDIDWIKETISFKQSKTGNTVILPLL